jgi:hypothetical protein
VGRVGREGGPERLVEIPVADGALEADIGGSGAALVLLHGWALDRGS